MKRQESLNNQLSQHLGHIAEARQRTLAGNDAEGLHDLRVAIRGLRVVLSILGKPAANLRQEWRLLAQATGPSRDLEVLIKLIDSIPTDLSSVRATLVAQTQVSRTDLLQQLSAAKVPCLIQQSRRTLEQIMEQQDSRALRHRAAKQAQHFRTIIEEKILLLSPSSPPQEWHQFRIDVKRLRYLIEHCGICLPRHWQPLHPVLKYSQSALGELHDIDLLIEISHQPLPLERQFRLNAASVAIAALKDKL